MRRRQILFVFLSAAPLLGAATFAPEPPSGAPVVAAKYPEDGKPESVIGKLKVEGEGEIVFRAYRTQNRLMLKAFGANGIQVGRAESVVGLGDTPIYIQSEKGLYKILVHWAR
jgi:hypothetical protein